MCVREFSACDFTGGSYYLCYSSVMHLYPVCIFCAVACVCVCACVFRLPGDSSQVSTPCSVPISLRLIHSPCPGELMRSSAKMDMTTCTRISEYQASSIRLELQNILKPSVGYRLRCLKADAEQHFDQFCLMHQFIGFFVKKTNVQYTIDQRSAINNSDSSSVLPEHAGILPGCTQVGLSASLKVARIQHQHKLGPCFLCAKIIRTWLSYGIVD